MKINILYLLKNLQTFRILIFILIEAFIKIRKVKIDN